MRYRNLPYNVSHDDWDDEWQASLRGQHLGVYGDSVREQLAGLVAGDTRELLVYPVVPALRSGTNRAVTKAWFTVKAKETDTDGAALFQLAITTTNNPGVGQIVSATLPELRFDLTAANTALLAPHKDYYFDVQMKMDDGAIYTVERGTLTAAQGITTTTS